MKSKKSKLNISDFKVLVELAIAEDIGPGDITSKTVNLPNEFINTKLVSREKGVLSGLPIAAYILKLVAPKCKMNSLMKDGDALKKGSVIATIKGPTTQLLTAERLILNFLQRLSGVASVTALFVEKTKGTKAKILDTRKTTPGWRKLEKYAVQCGGGMNHRMGLYDMVMIKDNHIASLSGKCNQPVAESILRARKKVKKGIKIIVEVDTIDQLKEALPAKPDVILLDNMSTTLLKQAVKIRNQFKSKSELEASGGVNLKTIRSIAVTGVERISVGSITHSVKSLDIGLDH